MVDNPNQDYVPTSEERRKYVRIKKNFILSYFDVKIPDIKYEVTQLKNISMGGMCFVTTQKFDSDKILGIELKTPYLTDITYIEAKVLESHEKVKDMLYETRLQFHFLDPEAEFLLARLIDFFINEEKKAKP